MYKKVVRFSLWLLGLTALAGALSGQAAANPFELSTRLGAQPVSVTAPAADSSSADAVPGNPFELRKPSAASVAPSGADTRRPAPKSARRQATVIKPDNTWLLGMVVGSLLLTTLSLTFFRGLYAKCYRAALSDNLLSQLFREREGAGVLPFALIYLVFLLNAGLFIYLLNQAWHLWPAGPIQVRTFVLSGSILALLLLKHFTLALMGYIFPVSRETKLYSFTIMVFAILAGLMLAPFSLLLAYSPAAWREPALYTALALWGGLYLLRTVRGVVIANRFIFLHQFHFLLYICAIEIMPVLFLYKLLSSSAS